MEPGDDMVAGGRGGGSGSGWSPPPLNQGPGSPTTEEHIEGILAATDDTYEAWRWTPWMRKQEHLFSLGCLDIQGLLDPLIDAGDWTQALEYLVRSFRFHCTKAKLAGAAVPGDRDIWEIRWSHPELYMLPQVQDALELAGRGDVAAARERHDDLHSVVDWATQNNGRDYGDFLRDMLVVLGNVVDRRGLFRISQQELAEERERTKAAIHDYLYVYLPEPSGRLRQVPAATDPYWLLADRVPNQRRFRCLLCHKVLVGDFWNVQRHVARCKALTPSVKARLQGPKDGDNKGKAHDADPGPGPSSGGGGLRPGAGGAGAGALVRAD